MPAGDSVDKVHIFDTTLRDGEQSPGFSMNVVEKVRMARQLEHLGVDIIEGGFPIASPGDMEGVRTVARQVRGCRVAGLARACQKDVDAALTALAPAAHPRLHIFLATSDLHLRYKLRISRQDALDVIAAMVRYGRDRCEEVEFSAEDASRSDIEFLCRASKIAVDAGATILNLPDTVGYAIPSEYAAMFAAVREYLGDRPGITFSAHCHNDLGLAVANSLAAVAAGARQVECTINGIGERAGNASLEEIVMAVRVRADQYPYTTGIASEHLYPTSQMLEEITEIPVQPNKAIIGRNAFAHEAGIHQDGMLKNRLTYEIMTPQSVGVPDSKLVLGKHSGRHALSLRCDQLGYHFERRELDEIYRKFVVLADQIKHVHDHHLLGLIHETYGEAHRIPPGRVDSDRSVAAAANAEGQGRRLFPAVPAAPASDFSAASLPNTPGSEHLPDQEDYLWGV